MNRDYLLRQIALQRKYEKDCLPGKPVKQVNLSGEDFSGLGTTFVPNSFLKNKTSQKGEHKL